jgi:hypothetical protein
MKNYFNFNFFVSERKDMDYNIICKGCSSETGMSMDCDLKPIYNGYECPCLECLMKPVCKETSETCPKYQKFCKISRKESNDQRRNKRKTESSSKQI